MIVLAHRGNLRGPAPGRENSLALVEQALSLGFGLETDVRYSAGHGFYISHDVAAAGGGAAPLGAHCELWRRHPGAAVALNVKELGREAELLEALRAMRVMQQVFLFDMELIEPRSGETARLYRRLEPSVAVAARVSDRREPLERALGIEAAGVIWLDEFDGPWATVDTVGKLKNAGKTIYAVSPELHGRRVEEARARWCDFARWGVDGICTDWPELLRSDLSAMFKTGT
jgi:glycerophosphoryl diester phosphodiesterase